MRRWRHVSYPPEVIKACIYILVVVVLFVLIGMRSCAHDHAPGCYYTADAKVPASIASSEGIDFVENNGWKPSATPGTSVYIVYVLSEGSDTCTILYDGHDPMKTSYATEVPLSSLNYVKTNLGEAINSKGFTAGVYSEGNDKGDIVLDILIIVISMFLLGKLIRFIVRSFILNR